MSLIRSGLDRRRTDSAVPLAGERACGIAGGGLHYAQDWTPAFAGDADFVRFHCRCVSENGVILGLVPRIPVICFEGINCESPRWANIDSRHKAENDSAGGVGSLR